MQLRVQKKNNKKKKNGKQSSYRKIKTKAHSENNLENVGN